MGEFAAMIATSATRVATGVARRPTYGVVTVSYTHLTLPTILLV